MLNFRWFYSGAVRQLSETCRLVRRLENEQRDLLTPEAIANLDQGRRRAREAIERRAGPEELKQEKKALEAAATKFLRPYRSAAIRENVKEMQVAIVTILAFTTFFLQLTKIPTGSMQPTLFGITYENLAKESSVAKPSLITRLWQYWTLGESYKELVAPFDGQVLKLEPIATVFPFVKRQRLLFGDPRNPASRQWLTLWFPPDDRWPEAAGLTGDKIYQRGEPIIRLRAHAGDHLLVDRLTYNFRRPKRGEVIVFKTRGIPSLPQDVLYIKRLVALPGEKVRIGNDQHLVIDGHRLSASDPRFENVYTITNPGESHYSGHVNDQVAHERFEIPTRYPIAPLFPDEHASYQVPPDHFLVMGDNTLNSLDSRAWGAFPQENVIGRCWFVYWPFTSRFGWGTW